MSDPTIEQGSLLFWIVTAAVVLGSLAFGAISIIRSLRRERDRRSIVVTAGYGLAMAACVTFLLLPTRAYDQITDRSTSCPTIPTGRPYLAGGDQAQLRLNAACSDRSRVRYATLLVGSVIITVATSVYLRRRDRQV